MQRLLQWSHGWRIYINYMTNVQMSTNVQRADRVSRQSFSSLNQPISGVLFLWKSQEWMPWLPLLKWEDWVNSRGKALSKLVVLRPSPHSSCAESRPRCGLSRCSCLLLEPAQKVEECTGSSMKSRCPRCLLLVVLQARSPSGREEPSVAGITDGVWLSCGVPRPPLLHHTFWGRNRRTSVWLLKPARRLPDGTDSDWGCEPKWKSGNKGSTLQKQ